MLHERGLWDFFLYRQPVLVGYLEMFILLDKAKEDNDSMMDIAIKNADVI